MRKLSEKSEENYARHVNSREKPKERQTESMGKHMYKNANKYECERIRKHNEHVRK